MHYGSGLPVPHQPRRPARVLDHAERQMILAQTVAGYTGSGWQIAGGYGYTVTLARGTSTNHVLHLLITFFTCGVWAPVWLLISIVNGYSTATFTVAVDEYGRVGQIHTQ